MQKSTKRRVALEESLIRIDQDDPSQEGLRGNRCRECNLTFFPKRQYCARCCAPLHEEVLLPRHGKLVSYTLLHRKPPYSVIQVPYIMGEIDTGLGTKVVSVVRGQPAKMAVGMDVELVLEKLREDEENNDVITYFYKPTGGFTRGRVAPRGRRPSGPVMKPAASDSMGSAA